MNSEEIKKIALDEMPKIEPEIAQGLHRQDVVQGLSGDQNVGIELGVAEGIFSRRMMDSGKFCEFYGVDIYGDIHNVDEYKRALSHVGLQSPYKLLRMTFDDAVDLFPDEYFDFIYIDGFAHSGEEGGKTLIDWYAKLKVGGIFAGDDYHMDWPLVVWAVNHFAQQAGERLQLTGEIEEQKYCEYPSWFMRKTETSHGRQFSEDARLLEAGAKERQRIERMRMKGRSLPKRLLKKLISKISV